MDSGLTKGTSRAQPGACVRLILVLVAASSLGFTVISEGTEPVRWPDRRVEVWIQPDGVSNISDGSDVAAIRAAMAIWTQVPCSDFEILEAGTDASLQPIEDGKNSILFVEGGWNGPAGAGGHTFRYETEGQPDTWREFDIALNAVDYEWTTAGEGGTVDTLSVVLHELGHVFALQHASLPETTMFFRIKRGRTHSRTLHPDDLLGLCYLYPLVPFACVEDGECPFMYNWHGSGGNIRTHCDGGVCVPGAVGYSLDCLESTDCLSGFCQQDPSTVRSDDPGYCTETCDGVDCPTGELCSDAGGQDVCCLGRVDCVDNSDCAGDNEECEQDFDGRFRCLSRCPDDNYCESLVAGTICHQAVDDAHPGVCATPGPSWGGEPCENPLDCASLACGGGVDPACLGPPRPEQDGGPREDGAPGPDGGDAAVGSGDSDSDPAGPASGAVKGGCAAAPTYGWVALLIFLFGRRRRQNDVHCRTGRIAAEGS